MKTQSKQFYKYYNTLWLLHDNIKEKKVIKLIKFLEHHKVNTKLGALLIKKGIVTKLANNHHFGNLYRWDGVKPNKYMVNSLIEELRVIRRSYNNYSTNKEPVQSNIDFNTIKSFNYTSKEQHKTLPNSIRNNRCSITDKSKSEKLKGGGIEIENGVVLKSNTPFVFYNKKIKSKLKRVFNWLFNLKKRNINFTKMRNNGN